jgi:hypothetical protein
MKKILLWTLCFLLPIPAFSVDLEIGDSEEQVMKELGFPDGSIDLKDGSLWLFEDGKVLMVDGRVAQLDMLTAEERDFKKQDQQRSKKAHAAYEKDRQARINEGLAVRNRQLANSSFLSQSAESQLRYWKGFQQTYPGVDVSGPIRELNQEVMTTRAARERLAQQTQTRIVHTQSSRYWCNDHGYHNTGYRCSSYHRHSSTHVEPGVTEFEDASFFIPPITTLPGGPVRTTLRPDLRKN